MKKIFNVFASVIVLQFLACSSPQTENQAPANEIPVEIVSSGDGIEAASETAVAKIEIQNDGFDFGTIQQGQKVEHTFTFKNVGNSPLIVTGATASCGCTTPEFSNHPIAPGADGMVKVVFDSEGQIGQQHKVIIVTSNAENNMVQFHLRGLVNQKN